MVAGYSAWASTTRASSQAYSLRRAPRLSTPNPRPAPRALALDPPKQGSGCMNSNNGLAGAKPSVPDNPPETHGKAPREARRVCGQAQHIPTDSEPARPTMTFYTAPRDGSRSPHARLRREGRSGRLVPVHARISSIPSASKPPTEIHASTRRQRSAIDVGRVLPAVRWWSRWRRRGHDQCWDQSRGRKAKSGSAWTSLRRADSEPSYLKPATLERTRRRKLAAIRFRCS